MGAWQRAWMRFWTSKHVSMNYLCFSKAVWMQGQAGSSFQDDLHSAEGARLCWEGPSEVMHLRLLNTREERFALPFSSLICFYHIDYWRHPSIPSKTIKTRETSKWGSLSSPLSRRYVAAAVCHWCQAFLVHLKREAALGLMKKHFFRPVWFAFIFLSHLVVSLFLWLFLYPGWLKSS